MKLGVVGFSHTVSIPCRPKPKTTNKARMSFIINRKTCRAAASPVWARAKAGTLKLANGLGPTSGLPIIGLGAQSGNQVREKIEKQSWNVAYNQSFMKTIPSPVLKEFNH
jgi:hypothetical protein